MSSGVTISNSSSETVDVYAVGALLAGDTVRAGIGGPLLTVSSTTPAHQVTIANASGAAVTLAAGTRLIDVSNRPTAYADELGAYALASTIYADSSGRATAYLRLDACDYIVLGNDPPVADTYSTGFLTGVGPTMSFNHTASGESRVVLVGISWQEPGSTETLDSVTYDGVEMTHLASNGMIDLYGLINPPTGTKTIVATWSGTNVKGAAAGALGFTNADQAVAFGVGRVNGGSGTTATIVVKDTYVHGLVLAALAVDTTGGTTTATSAATPQVAQWNLSGGSVLDVTRTLGAGATKPSDPGNVTQTWTINPTQNWQTAGAEILPAGIRLYADQTGTACPTRGFGLNAEHYASIQEAIDALPAKGGVLYIPAGTYRLRKGLVINKPNVTLIGEGELTVITPDDPDAIPVDLLTISGEETRISRMKFDGAAVDPDLENGTSCIVVNGQGVSGRLVIFCRFDDLILTGASRYGLWLKDTISFLAINCSVFQNRGSGLRIQGTDTPLGSAVAVRFYSSNFSYNGSIGADLGDIGTGVVGITFFACAFEGNQGVGVESFENAGTAITALEVAQLEIHSCYFEVAPVDSVQFVHLGSCLASVVENCWFEGGGVPARAAKFVNSAYSRFVGNSVEGVTSEIVYFDLTCFESIEFGNRDMNPDADGYARIAIQGPRVIGMSRGAMGIPRHEIDGTLPDATTNPQPGSMAWVDDPELGDSNLQIWDGSAWRNIDLT